MSEIRAPWTPEQVEGLNRYQRAGYFHPFTCGGPRGDDAHRRYAEEHGDHDLGILVAYTDGWVCPACDYKQNWAHEFMAVPPGCICEPLSKLPHIEICPRGTWERAL